MPARFRFSISSFLIGLMAMIVLLAITFAVWMQRGFSVRQKPSVIESALAHFALKASMSGEAGLANPVSSSPEALAEARAHFADHCSSCHANNGSGHTMYGDGLNPPPPDLRLAATQSKTDGELYAIIKNGVRMTGMPAFGTQGDDDLSTWKLVLFIRHLPSLTPGEERAMEKANPVSPSELEEQKEEDEFLQGTPTQPKGSKQ